MTGGYTDVMRSHYMQENDSKLYSFDVVSLYPTIMTKYKLFQNYIIMEEHMTLNDIMRLDREGQKGNRRPRWRAACRSRS